MNSLHLVYLGFLNLGPTEIVLVLLVAVLLFGGRLPEVARTLGRQFFDMKRNLKDLQSDIYRQDAPPPKAIPKPYYQQPVDAEPSPSQVTDSPDVAETADKTESPDTSGTTDTSDKKDTTGIHDTTDTTGTTGDPREEEGKAPKDQD